MRFPRSCGTLVHPTSFSGKYGIGDFGTEAREFIDFLKETEQTIWQILPLNPTGYGNSPYAGYSAFAGNPYLISPDILIDKGLLTKEEAIQCELHSTAEVSYDEAIKNKNKLFQKASNRFYLNSTSESTKALSKFKTQNAYWLQDYAMFMAYGTDQGMRSWNRWDNEFAQRESKALLLIKEKYAEKVRFYIWLQFEFYNQWNDLKEYANERDIRIIGDIPIFVDHNSSDVWANQHFFDLDENGNRVKVAGVPPDYFSKTGQLWGNPLYKWEELKKDGFSWWIERFKHVFSMYDAVRVDHFRGFCDYWEIEATEQTAEKGRWVKAPGEELFDVILKECGQVPIIAEDLGLITEEVEMLRMKYAFPGMKILQFAFDSTHENSFLPHNYEQNSVVYSGTHDNDTAIGWYNSAPEDQKHRFRMYTNSAGEEINWEFIRMGMSSVADQAIFPLQDWMGLDQSHRMNIPGTSSGNWLWRYSSDMLKQVDTTRIKELVINTNRKS